MRVVLGLVCVLAGLRSAAAAEQGSSKVQPALDLEIQVPKSGAEWKLEIENKSPEPVSLVDDMRLLRLEVSEPGASKPVFCSLPPSIVPRSATAISRKRVDPGDRIVRSFDPRFYCFDDDESRRLGAGARVVPHFGWPTAVRSARQRRRGASDDRVVVRSTKPDRFEPVSEIVGRGVVLEPGFSFVKTSSSQSPGAPRELRLDMARGSDAATARSATVTVRLTNTSSNSVTVYFRRALLTFDVVGERGTVTCKLDEEIRHPSRLSFTRLPPGKSASFVTRLVEFCPRGTFASRGFYLVSTEFESDRTGEDFGLHAFTGKLRAAVPVPVRIRRTIQLFPSHPVPSPVAKAPTQAAPPPRQSAPSALPPANRAPAGRDRRSR